MSKGYECVCIYIVKLSYLIFIVIKRLFKMVNVCSAGFDRLLG